MRTHVSSDAATTFLFSCSGAADVGAIADLAARQSAREKRGTLCCTAAVSAGIDEVLSKLHTAKTVVAVDGCPNACARKILESHGVCGLHAVRADELGHKKGASPVTQERIDSVVEAVRKAITPAG